MVMTEVVMVNDDESKSVLVLTLSTKLTRLQVTLQLEEKLTHLGGNTAFIEQVETHTNCSLRTQSLEQAFWESVYLHIKIPSAPVSVTHFYDGLVPLTENRCKSCSFLFCDIYSLSTGKPSTS